MRRLVVTVLSVLALLWGSSSAHAITGGQPDGGDHPHVVTLLGAREGEEGLYSCSGTLLSPTLVLTAGHCLERANGQLNDFTYVSNAPEPLDDYSGGGLASYLPTSENWVEGEAIPHPDYDNFSGFPDTYDVGLVVLEEGIDTGGVYGQLPQVGMLEALMTRKGPPSQRQVVVVGYGMQATTPESIDIYERYRGTATITGLGRSKTQGQQNVQLSSAPGRGVGGGGTCYGDSGGPAFWVDPATGEETAIVVAVTSFGTTGEGCVGMSFSFRTDTAWVHDFVADYR